MRIDIKNPAPDDDTRQRWGDFYFGNCVSEAFERRGVDVRQDFWPQWSQGEDGDVIVVLRGIRDWRPPAEKFCILWIISHPARVDKEELDAYDLVLTASAFHLSLLKNVTDTPVELARQCTDSRSFYPPPDPITSQSESRTGIVYVANSRIPRREMGRWIAEAKIDARLFGRDWNRFGIGDLVEKNCISNQELPELYRTARVGLNDHWHDMRAFGFISNRVFDCVACGLPVVTDAFPEIRHVFGDALVYVQNAGELRSCLASLEADYQEALQRVRDTWDAMAPSHTFDARAAEILDWIEAPPASRGRQGTGPAPWEVHQALREHVEQERERHVCLERLVSSHVRESEALQRETDMLRSQLDAVYNSYSWRVMAPARAVVGMVMSLFGARVEREAEPPARPLGAGSADKGHGRQRTPKPELK